MTPNDPGRRSSCRTCDLDQHARAFLRSSSTRSGSDSIPATLLSTSRSQRTVAAPNSPDPRNIKSALKSVIPSPLLDPKSASAPRAVHGIDGRLFRGRRREGQIQDCRKGPMCDWWYWLSIRIRRHVRAEPDASTL